MACVDLSWVEFICLEACLSQWARVEFNCHEVVTITEKNTWAEYNSCLQERLSKKCRVIKQTNQKLNNAVSCQDIPINTVQNIQMCENLLFSLG